AGSWFEHLRSHFAWWKLILARLGYDSIRWLLPREIRRGRRPVEVFTNFRQDLQAVAKARGLNLSKVTDRTQWLKPHVYPGLPVITYNAWQMEFPHAPAAELAYVGPMVQRQRVEGRVTDAEYQAWEAFRTRQRDDPNRKLIYCSLGTFWSTDTSLLRRVIEVFQRRTEWDLVIGLGGKLTAKQLGCELPNVLVLDYAPQLEILEAADAAITHGGIGTINECIWYNVPMLVVSTGHVDQDGCAARIEYHQLGVTAPVDCEDVESLLARLLTEESIQANLRTMQRCFKAKETEQQHAQTVERLIGAPAPTRSAAT
ncbi:MAG: glycosyltransferase, partial [Planctomycetota bacterium]